MLHGLKLAIAGRGEKSVLETDQRLKEADKVISELQRWFPQLQAGIEENEKTWATLSYNIRTVASSAQEIYKENHPMQYSLDSLHGAGAHVVKPPPGDPLEEERLKSFAALRSFNESVRELRILHSSCVLALKNKDYYETKVETMRVNESKKKKVTDRDVEKRLRNEHKFREMEGEMNFKADRLQRELTTALENKENVLEIVLSTFVLSQSYYFGRNPMPPVVSSLASRISPRSVRGLGEYTVNTDLYSPKSVVNPVSPVGGLPPPPRAPSPPLVSTSHPSSLYPANSS